MVSNAELTTAIDSIGAPIIIVDVKPDERFVWRLINKSAERYFDLQNDEWVGKEVDSYEGLDEIRISHRKRSAANYKRCVATKAPVFVENEHRGPDGVLWARNTIVPIFNDAGEVKQIMVTILDVTELIETQHRLEDALTKTLSGFVTICANCKDIQDGSENWVRVEQYMANHSNDVQFSHGYCPKCYESAVQELK